MRQGVRLFRVDRMLSISTKGSTFKKPSAIDIRAYVESELNNVPAKWRAEIWLAASPETLRYDLVPSRSQMTSEDGGIMLRCNVNVLESLAAQLLALSCRFVIRQPRELVVALNSLAARASEMAQSHLC